MMKNKIYEKAGVSLDKGYEVVSRIKPHAQKTFNLGAMSNIGSFGGLFDIAKYKVKDPVLVSGTDGVGTKLILAIESNKYETIGQDLVAMCVNDIITTGAKPLFFLDYFATGNLNPKVVEKVISGICDALKPINTMLLGGETAEMPDMYKKDDFDLAGFAVGVVDRKEIIDGIKNVKKDDVLIALPSSGIHSNGFSLVRKIFFKDHKKNFQDKVPGTNQSLIDVLLTPTKIYVNQIAELKKQVKINGISHITGGGFFENIPRMMSKNLKFEIDFSRIEISPIFKWMQELSGATVEEMFSTFNMGVGMVIAVNAKYAKKTIKILNSVGEDAYEIGKVVAA